MSDRVCSPTVKPASRPVILYLYLFYINRLSIDSNFHSKEKFGVASLLCWFKYDEISPKPFNHCLVQRYNLDMKIVASILFVLLLLLQAQLWFGSHGVFQLWSLQRTTEELKQANSQMIERNEQLHAEVKELRLGEEALEERARSHLGFIREGEKFYRIIPEKSSNMKLTNKE